MAGFNAARLLAVALPAGLLGGAYVSEYGFGLYPCEMCWWQRYPHFAALCAGLVSFVAVPPRVWTALAGLAILTSGLIGGFHAGVEYGWWEGITGCARVAGGLDVLDPAAAPLIRCDQAPWSLLGISLAGWNFLFSSIGGIAILVLSAKKEQA
ncbi:disulfide bond formation protein B [Erythrobacter sp. HL-111]|uniref:disulfide bond formation protein B n=1 Tax=Erythrobacter sp. HL-111 TaxID=1798193 RepID=UPI0006DBA503|nr:disulfide bond formation protein B [Erythrobacter sp. HL-111]KPP95493.1 MAG: Disulfide bond formation protein DsbB [Erythrobacteraceae bacterium HL-111]SDS73264.1 Disulfide bond formation protein DsbB [Erythrobacter sp. HL-111]